MKKPSLRSWLIDIAFLGLLALAMALLGSWLSRPAKSAEVQMFSTDTCPACVQLRPLVQQLRSLGWPVRETKITSANLDLAQRLRINKVPCWVLFDDAGREVARSYDVTNWQAVKALLDYQPAAKQQPQQSADCAGQKSIYQQPDKLRQRAEADTPQPTLDPGWRPPAQQPRPTPGPALATPTPAPVPDQPQQPRRDPVVIIPSDGYDVTVLQTPPRSKGKQPAECEDGVCLVAPVDRPKADQGKEKSLAGQAVGTLAGWATTAGHAYLAAQYGLPAMAVMGAVQWLWRRRRSGGGSGVPSSGGFRSSSSIVRP